MIINEQKLKKALYNAITSPDAELELIKEDHYCLTFQGGDFYLNLEFKTNENRFKWEIWDIEGSIGERQLADEFFTIEDCNYILDVIDKHLSDRFRQIEKEQEDNKGWPPSQQWGF